MWGRRQAEVAQKNEWAQLGLRYNCGGTVSKRAREEEEENEDEEDRTKLSLLRESDGVLVLNVLRLRQLLRQLLSQPCSGFSTAFS